MNKSKIKIHRLSKKKIEKDEELTGIIAEIMKESWGDPGCSVGEWLPTVDVVYIALSGKRIAGFASGDFISKDILYLHATVVHKDFSGLGLYKKLNSKVISKFVLEHPFVGLKGFWCVFRTSNPSLYERVYKLFPLFPDYKNNRKSNTNEQEILRKIRMIASPQSDVDFETFVVRQAYKEWPGLIRKPEEIPYAFSVDINEFFENKIHLTEMDGSAMICMGRIKLQMIINQFVKKNIGTHR
jgi:hypothetical protein